MKLSDSHSDLHPTKRKLLEGGIALMRSKGFNATSVSDICEAAGVTKGGFFHYFASKEELAKEASALFREETVQAYQRDGFPNLPDPLDRIVGRLEFLKRSQRSRQIYGCLIGTLAQELSTTHPDLRAIFHNVFGKMSHDLETDLAAAKALYAPGSGLDPAGAASLFVSMFQGSLMMAKASGSADIVIRNLDSYLDYIRTFFKTAFAKRESAAAKAETR